MRHCDDWTCAKSLPNWKIETRVHTIVREERRLVRYRTSARSHLAYDAEETPTWHEFVQDGRLCETHTKWPSMRVRNAPSHAALCNLSYR